jgi:hypothetical protein
VSDGSLPTGAELHPVSPMTRPVSAAMEEYLAVLPII